MYTSYYAAMYQKVMETKVSKTGKIKKMYAYKTGKGLKLESNSEQPIIEQLILWKLNEKKKADNKIKEDSKLLTGSGLLMISKEKVKEIHEIIEGLGKNFGLKDEEWKEKVYSLFPCLYERPYDFDVCGNEFKLDVWNLLDFCDEAINYDCLFCCANKEDMIERLNMYSIEDPFYGKCFD